MCCIIFLHFWDRWTQGFQEHIGTVVSIINKVLMAESVMESDTQLAQRLLPYVVIKSSPKISRRLTSGYSRHYLELLKGITPRDINAFPLSKPLQLQKSQIRRDRAFLTVIGGDTQEYLKWIGVETPCILDSEALAKVKNGGIAEGTFYSAATSGEVHTLLCALLQDLADYTCIVTQLTSTPKEKFHELHVFKEVAKLDDDVIEAMFEACAHRLCICLHLLWVLVYSGAIEAHISRIQSRLTKYTTTEAVRDKSENVGDDDDQDEVDEEDAANEEQDLIDADSEMEDCSNFTSCMRWLRLQVTHYQAIDILGQTCRKLTKEKGQREFPSVSIKIIANRHPGKEMQHWQELIKELAATGPTDGPGRFDADAAIVAVRNWMDTNRRLPDVAGSNKAGPARPLSVPGERKKIMPTWYTMNEFTGTYHCEAVGASLIGNKNVDADVVDAFRVS